MCCAHALSGERMHTIHLWRIGAGIMSEDIKACALHMPPPGDAHDFVRKMLRFTQPKSAQVNDKNKNFCRSLYHSHLRKAGPCIPVFKHAESGNEYRNAGPNVYSRKISRKGRCREIPRGYLTVMEERISAISAIADRNLQNAGETEQSSGSLDKEAEALQAQVQKFILKEKRGG